MFMFKFSNKENCLWSLELQVYSEAAENLQIGQ